MEMGPEPRRLIPRPGSGLVRRDPYSEMHGGYQLLLHRSLTWLPSLWGLCPGLFALSLSIPGLIPGMGSLEILWLTALPWEYRGSTTPSAPRLHCLGAAPSCYVARWGCQHRPQGGRPSSPVFTGVRLTSPSEGTPATLLPLPFAL